MLLSFLLSCQPDIAPEALSDSPTPSVLLRRIALDLNGILPSQEAMAEVEESPERLHHWIDVYLESPLLKERWVHLFNERWHTRIDFSPVIFFEEYYSFHDDPSLEYTVERSIMEEPLRVLTEVLYNDEHWETIVTADWTMANETLAEIWPLDYPGDGGWTVSYWTDQRPAAGVLSTNGLWKRYYSTPSNMNRQRAAALTKLLLCTDYTERQIDFSQLDPEEEVDNAIRENPYCLGCHSSLDPIAAALFGFYSSIPFNIDEHDIYHPEREVLAEELIGVPPAFFGQPLNGLNELGGAIAADPRFSQCTVQSFTELLWKRRTTNADFSTLNDLQVHFEQEQMRPQSLIKAIVSSTEYQTRPRELLSPDQFSTVLQNLTGFHWTWQGYDQMDNDTYGYRILAGGVDGSSVLERANGSTFTQVLVFQRLAEAAAWTVVDHDIIQDNSPKRLFNEHIQDLSPSDPSFEQQLSDLHWLLYAQPPSAEWTTATIALWKSIEPMDGPAQAWQGVLTALFQDPEMMVY